MSDLSTITQSGMASEMLMKQKMLQAQNSIQATTDAKNNVEDHKVRKVAENFEAMFLTQMLQPMFQDIPVGDKLGGGHAEKMFRGMMVNEMGKGMARAGGIGLSDMIYKEMIKMQEAA